MRTTTTTLVVNAAVAIAAVTLASCSTFQPRPIDAPAAAANFESRRLDDAGLRRFIGPSASPEWNLETLTLAAFYFHPDLDVSRARLDIARAAIVTARERPNPILALGAQRSENPPDGMSPWKLAIGLDVPVETAGKRGIRTLRARQLAEKARLDVTTTAWKVRARVRAALLDDDLARQSTALLERQEALQHEIAGMLEVRRSVGEASLVDLMQARIAEMQTELLLRDAQSTLLEARARLAAAIGIPLAALDSVNIVPALPPEHPLPDSPELRRVALTQRSDIRALLAEYAAAESALRLEIAHQYPDIHVAPGYAWDQGVSKWALGFSAALPIFNQNRGPIAEAEASRKETAARFTALQAKVIGDLDAASTAYGAALEKLKSADALLSLNEGQAKEIGTRFERGEADRLELRSAQLQVNTIALSRISALRDVQQALGDLEAALQQPVTGAPISNLETSPRPAEDQ